MHPLPVAAIPASLPLEFQLAQTRDALAQFTAHVAYDLHAPLRSMVSYSELLEKKCNQHLDEQTRHYLERIAENNRLLQARIAGLMQYARLDAAPLQSEAVQTRLLVNRCLQQLQSEIEEREALIRVGPLPELSADGEKLSLLIYCLLSNALKFCTNRVDIEIGARREKQSWILTVRDTGIGIAGKDQELIFNIFQQLHPESDYPGIGIGLTLARRIAELHGGQLSVTSELGHGSLFSFTLPAYAAHWGKTA